jgi:Domain of unknown function (DUF4397)
VSGLLKLIPWCLLTIVFTAGCSQGGRTRLRVMNAVVDEPSLDVLVDGNTTSSNLAYGTSTGYQSVSSGSRHLQIEPSGSSTTLVDQMITFNSGTDTTILAANFSFSLSTVVLSDDNSAPTSGKVKMRFVNAAPDLGPADVYIVSPGTDITTLSPSISSLGFGSASEYQNMTAANYEIISTVATQKIPQIDSGSLSLAAGQIRTFVSLNSPAGGFTEAVLDEVN